MKKTTIYLFIVSLLLVFAITCQRKSNTQNDKSSDKSKWAQATTTVVDPDFLNTYGQLEYLAIAYAEIGGRATASNNLAFRNQLAASQYDIAGTGTDREESPILGQYNNNALKSTLTPWVGFSGQPDIGDAIIKWQGTPIGNGAPLQQFPFSEGFIVQFSWKETSNSTPITFYTYTNILGVDETYTAYQTHQNTYNGLPFLVIPLKNFNPALNPNSPNPYLPIKGYTWNSNTNSLNIVTFSNWDDVETAAMTSYYIVTVGIDRSNSPTLTSTLINCDNVICGDGFCNTGCTENCANDCSSRYKLELTSVTLTEDAEVKLSTAQAAYDYIHYREKYWSGKYEIHYAMALVHTDGTVELKDEVSYNKWTRRHVSRRSVDENNITGQRKHNGGTDHTHNNEQVLSENFVPFGPNGDRIYLLFWEDDWRSLQSSSAIPVQLQRLPGNQIVTSHDFLFQSHLGEYPFGSKPRNTFESGTTYGYFGVDDKFPIENLNFSDHVKIIDFTNFTVNQGGTEGTYIFTDGYESGDNSHNPRRGGIYGLQFSLRWRKTL